MGPLITSWQDAFVDAWNYTTGAVGNFAPRFIGAVILFFLGLIFGHWVRRIIEEILKAIRFDEGIQKSGFDRYLKRSQVGFKAREIVGILAYWFVVFIFSVAAVNVLAWKSIFEAVDKIVWYTPRVFIAAFILAVGWLGAKAVEIIIRGVVGAIDTKTNRAIGVLGRYVVVFFAFLLALGQLRIPEAWSKAFLANLGWTITIALGIAFGWGAKETVGKILADWYAGFKKEVK